MITTTNLFDVILESKLKNFSIKTAIVTTTIYKPSRAILRFCEIAEQHNCLFIIVGDLKTPHEDYYELEKNFKNIVYLSPEFQQDIDVELSELIGWNCIQRRNLGVLYAYQEGAEWIALVDDDNIPYDDWYDFMFLRKFTGSNFNVLRPKPEKPVLVNILDYYAKKYNYLLSDIVYDSMWVRGFPFELYFDGLLEEFDIKYDLHADFSPGIVIGLWNGVPDFDAVLRACTQNSQYLFEPKFDTYLLLDRNHITPFNSQNTVIHRNIVPYYFLAPHVGRMDDIWASYYVIAKARPQVVLTKATVFQARNPQSLVANFENELRGYAHNKKIIESICQGEDADSLFVYMPNRAMKAYQYWMSLF